MKITFILLIWIQILSIQRAYCEYDTVQTAGFIGKKVLPYSKCEILQEAGIINFGRGRVNKSLMSWQIAGKEGNDRKNIYLFCTSKLMNVAFAIPIHFKFKSNKGFTAEAALKIHKYQVSQLEGHPVSDFFDTFEGKEKGGSFLFGRSRSKLTQNGIQLETKTFTNGGFGYTNASKEIQISPRTMSYSEKSRFRKSGMEKFLLDPNKLDEFSFSSDTRVARTGGSLTTKVDETSNGLKRSKENQISNLRNKRGENQKAGYGAEKNALQVEKAR